MVNFAAVQYLTIKPFKKNYYWVLKTKQGNIHFAKSSYGRRVTYLNNGLK